MWIRNAVFVAVCLLAVAVLAGGLLDSDVRDAPLRQAARSRLADADFQSTLARLDESFNRRWEELDIDPARQADDLLVARRLSLALAGTLPSLEEIRFLESQPSETRLAAWVDRLLADRRYADYLAERLARALVGTEDGPFLLYRRRRFVTWLADQIHENRPYDRIVRELLTAEGLWTDEPATNFITVTLTDDDKRPDINRLATRVSRVFLGVRLDCAQCHDHPFDERWQQEDFQQLAAYFGQAEMSFTGIKDHAGPYYLEDLASDQKRLVEPRPPFAADLVENEQGRFRRRLARWLTHPENKAFARATVNRMWALVFGRPLVEPVDDLPPGGTRAAALEILAEDFAAHRFNLRRLIRLIAASEVFRLESRVPPESSDPQEAELLESTWALFPVTRLRPEQVVGGLLQAASLRTIDYESHILVRIMRAVGQQEFVERYGDAGAAEFEAHGGTIPQRLLMLNGELVEERTKENLLLNAATRIALLAENDAQAVEIAYLAVLTRRPTPAEAEHFLARLSKPGPPKRAKRMADLYWTLINSAEFSCNH